MGRSAIWAEIVRLGLIVTSSDGGGDCGGGGDGGDGAHVMGHVTHSVRNLTDLDEKD
ncbi:hypothetical protein TIFTF001_026887 [Ficus carica]|uniref:Uncharacterized protein n=1 Tax=Ficus carica TaxID=3494 RepID=A0AA88DM27_FICCA|nr:hypothetical protein TIFTF001_026887 [Ficus carica]